MIKKPLKSIIRKIIVAKVLERFKVDSRAVMSVSIEKSFSL